VQDGQLTFILSQVQRQGNMSLAMQKDKRNYMINQLYVRQVRL
jgi:hypothetical protein